MRVANDDYRMTGPDCAVMCKIINTRITKHNGVNFMC